MRLRPLAVLASAAAALSSAGSVTAAAPAVVTTVTQLGKSTVELSCAAASSTSCHYLFLSSLCQQRFLANGVKERTCRYMEATPPFRIRPGERKTVTDLPADFLYTMKLGAEPTADECPRSPIPH